jgi:hypothetical protein
MAYEIEMLGRGCLNTSMNAQTSRLYILKIEGCANNAHRNNSIRQSPFSAKCQIIPPHSMAHKSSFQFTQDHATCPLPAPHECL